MKNPAVLWSAQAAIAEGDAVNAADPARQMALVGKARTCGDFGKAQSPVANELDRTLQSQMHDIAMRRDADGSREDPGEVKRAAPRYVGQRGDLDRLVEMGDDIVPEPLEHVFAQHAPCPVFGLPTCGGQPDCR